MKSKRPGNFFGACCVWFGMLGFSGEPLNVRSSNVEAMGGGYGVCIIKKI